MNVKIVALGDSTLVMGLTLAGLENTRIVDSKTFEETLNSVISDKSNGIVVIQEDFLKNIDWRLKRKLDNLAYPVIVPVPGVSGESTEGDDIKNLIKRALGFDLMAQQKEE
ncbi:hypothetical protein JXB01_01920 [Candidatus Micrarchaeota archaeon]|nr:hypothetical protein [Candidatus Micrarchaeota archaeon]